MEAWRRLHLLWSETYGQDRVVLSNHRSLGCGAMRRTVLRNMLRVGVLAESVQASTRAKMKQHSGSLWPGPTSHTCHALRTQSHMHCAQEDIVTTSDHSSLTVKPQTPRRAPTFAHVLPNVLPPPSPFCILPKQHEKRQEERNGLLLVLCGWQGCCCPDGAEC